jgi:ClpX C4-type zinc finger protein
MTIDDELLKKAQAAGAQLAEAERQALLSRAEYHTTIRRLHLAGASLREIARAVSVSHQRVQQIVDDAGGSWWKRVWRTRNDRRDAVCTFCSRPPSEVSKLVAGPNVYICDTCVALAEGALSGRTAGPILPAKEGVKAQCSFCGKRRGDRRALVTGPGANVCQECLLLCRDIMDNRTA